MHEHRCTATNNTWDRYRERDVTELLNWLETVVTFVYNTMTHSKLLVNLLCIVTSRASCAYSAVALHLDSLRRHAEPWLPVCCHSTCRHWWTHTELPSLGLLWAPRCVRHSHYGTQFSVNKAAKRSVQKEPAWCGFISRPQDGSQYGISRPTRRRADKLVTTIRCYIVKTQGNFGGYFSGGEGVRLTRQEMR